MTQSPVSRRRVTLADVARHAGVSVATVSKAVRDAYGISDEMQKRVLTAVDELGYRPDRLARGMRGATYTVGLVVPSIENTFVDLLVRGLTSVLSDAGYDLFITVGSAEAGRQDAKVDAFIDHQVDGLVLVGPRQEPERLEEVAASVATVAIGRHGPARGYDTTASDDRLGSELIVHHLARLGHSRIAFVAETPDVDYDTLPEHVRRAGYCAAMRAHGLEREIDIISSEWSFDGGSRAIDELRGRTTWPTAVHAGSDIAALGMLAGLWDEGVDVPGQLSIAGYDNSPTGAMSRIGLTTVEQGGVAMGASAARLLLSRLRGRVEAVHELLPPTLVTRQTTARPRG